MRRALRFELEIVEEAGRHQHRHVAPPERHQRPRLRLGRGPERIGDRGAGPEPRPPRLGGGRQGIDGAGGEEDVSRVRGRQPVGRVGVVGQFLHLPALAPRLDLLLGVEVEAGIGLPVAHEHDLIEDLPLGGGEGPAVEVPVVGGEVAGRDGEPRPGHDEEEDAILGEVAGAVRQEAMLRPLLFPIKVVGRVEEQ